MLTLTCIEDWIESLFFSCYFTLTLTLRLVKKVVRVSVSPTFFLVYTSLLNDIKQFIEGSGYSIRVDIAIKLTVMYIFAFLCIIKTIMILI